MTSHYFPKKTNKNYDQSICMHSNLLLVILYRSHMEIGHLDNSVMFLHSNTHLKVLSHIHLPAFSFDACINRNYQKAAEV